MPPGVPPLKIRMPQGVVISPVMIHHHPTAFPKVKKHHHQENLIQLS